MWTRVVGIIVALGLFAAFGMVTGVAFQRLGFSAAALFGLLVLIGLSIWKPEWSTCIVVFTIYSNLAVAVLRFRQSGAVMDSATLDTMDTGLRAALFASVGVALVLPLFHYVWLQKQPLVADRSFALMWFYLFGVLLSAVVCIDPLFALQKIFRFLTEGLVLYFLVINVVRDQSTLRKVMWTLVLAAGFMAGLSVFQEATHTQNINYWGLAQRGGVFSVDASGNELLTRTRVAGPIGEQNRYAQILLMIVPFTIFFVRHGRTVLRRLGALLAGFLMLGGIVLTFSRGAAVALCILLCGMLLLRQVKWSQVLVVGILACSLVVVYEPEYVGRLSSIGRAQTLLNSADRPNADESATTRLAGNIASVKIFLEHPVLGVGRGIYSKYYATAEVYELGVRQVKNYPSHNLYLNLAAETGVVGLASFMAIIIWIVVHLRRQMVRHRSIDPEVADLAACFLLAVCAYLASGMFLHLAYERYFWLMIALSDVAIRVTGDEAVKVVQPVRQPEPVLFSRVPRFGEARR